MDLDTITAYVQQEKMEQDRIDRRRMVNSIIVRLKGETLSFEDAYHLVQEIVMHLRVEDAHHLLYEISHRFDPEIQRMCQIKQMEHERALHERLRPMFKDQYFKSDNPLYEELPIPKEDFLSKDEVKIE